MKMICPNCEFEIEDDTEICPYCHVFVNPPGKRDAKPEEPAGQPQTVLASPVMEPDVYYTEKEFLRSPQMKSFQGRIRFCFVVLYLSLFGGYCLWEFTHISLSISTPNLPGVISIFWALICFCLSYVGEHAITEILCIRLLGLPVFTVYLYVIGMFGLLVIIQRTYNRICALVFLLPRIVWGLWIEWSFLREGFLGLTAGYGSFSFSNVIRLLFEPVIMIILISELFRVHSAWKKYEQTRTEAQDGLSEL